MSNDASANGALVRLLICAMGGEGGGVLTGWIVEAARAAGLAVQATSVPGVAQRTGGTTYYIELAPRDGQGRMPVFALTPVPGQIEVVLASELVEGARAARLGFATPDRTTLICSTHRVFLIQEKMAMGDGRLAPEALAATVQARARTSFFLDMDGLALKCGVPISPVMLGALAGAGVLPIERRHFEQAVHDSGIAVPKNLAAFSAAFGEASAGAAGPAWETIAKGDGARAPGDYIIDSIATSRPELGGFTGAARDVVARGFDRLCDYQDAAYATLYRQRLEPFRSAEPNVLREAARQLALRMSYEDVIRVAQHKAHAARYERIQGELGAAAGEPVEVQDYFKPGVREMADLLPPSLARFVLRRAERNPRFAQAHIGMKVRTTSISGYLRVWMLAKLRPWRRRTYRYQLEQAGIESWLTLVQSAVTRRDDALASEIVELARLIKGYGDTHARGLANYARIVETLVKPGLVATPIPSGLAAAVRAAREAALADPEGQRLGVLLSAAGERLPSAIA